MTIPLTPEREAEIRARLAAAGSCDPMPWSLDDDGDVLDANGAFVVRTNASAALDLLIAHAPADLADLLAEVDRLRADAGRWSDYAQHQEWCRNCAEDGVRSCTEGRQLRNLARGEPDNDDT